jgi:hypothetical protein
MAVNSVQNANNLSANTARGPSEVIWNSCPWATMRSDMSQGMAFEDDFLVVGNADMTSAYKNSIGQWSVYGEAGATLNDGAKEGGVIKITSNAADEGVTLLSSAGSFRFVTTSTLASNQKMWFECRVAKSTVATAHEACFVGLMDPHLSSSLPAANQPLTTTDDTVATTLDSFGFNFPGTTGTRGGPTEVGVSFVLASGTTNHPTGLTTLMASSGNTVLAADTYVKLGWVFDPMAKYRLVTSATARQTVGTWARPLIQFYVNGLRVPTFLSGSDVNNATATQAFPTAFMSPCLAVMNAASASSDYLAIDWIRIAQRANS